MPDPDRGVIDAITRKLTDTGCPCPDAVAREIMAIIRGRGYRYSIERPEPWQHGGAGHPSPGSEAARLVAAYRARTQEAGHE
jgi:hypothetical protein